MFLTSCKPPLDTFSDLFVRCLHYAYILEYTKTLSDNMVLHML